MQLELTNPLLWVLGSLALAAIVTNIAWPVLHARWRGNAPAPSGAWGVLAPLIWLLTALFLFLPPIGAWRAGALSPYLMGLSRLDWLGALVSGGVLAAAICGIIVFGWLVYRHKLPPRLREDGPLQPWLAPVDAALLQWHWAFYRAGVIGWIILASEMKSVGPDSYLTRVVEQPLYWGSWLGMVLVAAEWALNPFARRALFAPRVNADYAPAAERTVIRMSLAVTTTALFILTRNFWLPLVCHVIVETAILAFLPAPTLPARSE
jgi:hypothetical protein